MTPEKTTPLLTHYTIRNAGFQDNLLETALPVGVLCYFLVF
jgi:hypothetical protein